MSERLLSEARDRPCVICGSVGTTVAAHTNDMEWKGIGKKAPDHLVAYLCHGCHDLVDGRAGGMTKQEKREMWDRAFKRTVHLWFRDGVVGVR